MEHRLTLSLRSFCISFPELVLEACAIKPGQQSTFGGKKTKNFLETLQGTI